MFDQLVSETASRFSISATSASALLRALLAFMINERNGGLEGFVGLFRRAGLGDLVASWFGGKEGRTLTPSHLESALGTIALDELAGASGLTRPAASSVLTFLLPKLMGAFTAGGELPASSALVSDASSYAIPSGVSFADGSEPKHGVPSWLPWAAGAMLALAGLLW